MQGDTRPSDGYPPAENPPGEDEKADHRVVVILCDEDVPRCEFGSRVGVLTVVSVNKEFPGVFSMNYPDPIPVKKIRATCGNAIEDCEVSVAIVGTAIR